MIVGKIWDCEYPWDVRVEKVCATLTAGGHRVELVCRNRRREPLVEQHNGLRINRMPVLRALPATFERSSSFPAFVNPRWYRLALRIFRERRVDVILSRDLPLAPVAIAVGRRLGKPVIVDVAEHYPGLLKDLYNAQDFRLGNLLIRNPALAGMLERWTLPRADAIWVVVEEMADRLARLLGIPRERITLVSNTPTEARIARLGHRPPPRPEPGALRLVYLGKVERSRGLHVVIDALALLREGPVRVSLDVYGEGRGLAHDRARVAELGLGDRVRFHGHRPYDEVLDRLSEYDLGVIPHHATDHWNYTIQNKLFDYLSARLPVVVSSMPPASRLVTSIGCGAVFQDRQPHTLRTALLDLADPERRAGMGDRGRRAVERELNWTRDGARLLHSIEVTVGRSLADR